MPEVWNAEKFPDEYFSPGLKHFPNKTIENEEKSPFGL